MFLHSRHRHRLSCRCTLEVLGFGGFHLRRVDVSRIALPPTPRAAFFPAVLIRKGPLQGERVRASAFEKRWGSRGNDEIKKETKRYLPLSGAVNVHGSQRNPQRGP